MDIIIFELKNKIICNKMKEKIPNLKAKILCILCLFMFYQFEWFLFFIKNNNTKILYFSYIL